MELGTNMKSIAKFLAVVFLIGFVTVLLAASGTLFKGKFVGGGFSPDFVGDASGVSNAAAVYPADASIAITTNADGRRFGIAATGAAAGDTNFVNDGQSVVVRDTNGWNRIIVNSNNVMILDSGSNLVFNAVRGYGTLVVDPSANSYLQLSNTGTFHYGTRHDFGGTVYGTFSGDGSALTAVQSFITTNVVPNTIITNPILKGVQFQDNNGGDDVKITQTLSALSWQSTSAPWDAPFVMDVTGVTASAYSGFFRQGTNSLGNANVDFAKGHVAITNLAGNWTITGCQNMNANEDNWQVIKLNANGADRTITVPADWYVSGFTNSTTVTVTNGTWAELGVSAIQGIVTQAVFNGYW